MNKPASLLVVQLGKAFSGITPSWCGRQMAGNSLASSYSAVSSSSTFIGDKVAQKQMQFKEKGNT